MKTIALSLSQLLQDIIETFFLGLTFLLLLGCGCVILRFLTP